MIFKKFNALLQWKLAKLILCTFLWFLNVSNISISSSRWLILLALRLIYFSYIHKMFVQNSWHFSVVIDYFIFFHQQNVIWVWTLIWEKWVNWFPKGFIIRYLLSDTYIFIRYKEVDHVQVDRWYDRKSCEFTAWFQGQHELSRVRFWWR